MPAPGRTGECDVACHHVGRGRQPRRDHIPLRLEGRADWPRRWEPRSRRSSSPRSTRSATRRSILPAVYSKPSPGCSAAYGESADDAPVYLEVLIDSRRHPELRAHVAEVFARIRTELTRVVTDLQQRKVLPEWVAPVAMAGLLLAVAQGVVLQTTIDGAGPASAAMADQFARLLLASRA